MGANNVLVMPGTASSNGVSLGSGSVKTLTPEDADAILRDAPPSAALAPIVDARAQVVYGNKNWVPDQHLRHHPGLPRRPRLGRPGEGEPFTDHDVRNVSMVCLLGQTLVRRAVRQDESPVGKEVARQRRPAARSSASCSRKGANIIGMDQDDILLAPWTTIKFRVSRPVGSADTSAGAAGSSSRR